MNDRIEKFKKFENDENLFELVVQNVRIWQLIRDPIFSLISDPHSQFVISSSSLLEPAEILRGIVAFGRNLLIRNPYFAKNSDLLFVGGGRRKEVDGIYYDIWTDPVDLTSEFDSLHLERNYRLKHFRPVATDRVYYLDIITHRGAIARGLGRNRPNLSIQDKQLIARLESAVEEEFNARLNILQLIRRFLHKRATTMPLFRDLLMQIDPQVVVLYNAYNQHSLIEASHQINVPVVELQHGRIGSNHLGYDFPQSPSLQAFPDYILIWGDFWREDANIPLPDNRVITVGYPWLERGVNRFAAVGASDQILFISNPSNGKALSQFAVECAEDRRLSDNIVYKLHPKECDDWQHRYPWLLNDEVKVIDGQTPRLYELFAESRAQVGMGSSATYEGLCFDLETYVYSTRAASPLSSLVDRDAAMKIDSVGALADQLGSGVNMFDPKYYFAPDSTRLMQKTLKQLMNTGRVYDQNL